MNGKRSKELRREARKMTINFRLTPAIGTPNNRSLVYWPVGTFRHALKALKKNFRRFAL